MNFEDYQRNEENAAKGDAMAQALQAILDDNDAIDVANLYHQIYKYTACGPWLSVKLHDGTWRDSDNLEGVAIGDVRSLLIGSIVEGTEVECTPIEIDLMVYAEDREIELAAADFESAVATVDEEASNLYNQGEEE